MIIMVENFFFFVQEGGLLYLIKRATCSIPDSFPLVKGNSEPNLRALLEYVQQISWIFRIPLGAIELETQFRPRKGSST